MKKVKVAKVVNKLPFKQYNIEYKWVTKKPLYIDKKDKRYKKYIKQLKEDGFSATETWCLSSVMAQFILPRLIRFKEICNGYPGNDDFPTMEKWYEGLDKMIFAFEWALANDEEENYKLSDEIKKANWDKYEEGMKLFTKYFMALWW